jgi:hypothetical protein
MRPTHLTSGYKLLYTQKAYFNRAKSKIFVDHFVSDGGEYAKFMQALAGFLENLVRMRM